MKTRARIWRGAVAAPLATLMLALSVAMPVMERADVGHEPVLEREHDPGRCLPAHDHSVCTQVGANLAVPTVSPPTRIGPTVARSLAPSTSTVSDGPPDRRGPPSRAPPSA